MKTTTFVGILCCSLILAAGCKKASDKEKTGVLQFRAINPLKNSNKSTLDLRSLMTNPPLTGDTTVTYTTSFRVAVGDVWVSQDEVQEGNTDNLEWMRLTSTTNTELKLFEDYVFAPVVLPVGTYRSIKITFRNVFYRYAQLASDPATAFELLETMGSWTSPCDESDTSWAKTNYFGSGGNHYLENGVFVVASAGEKVAGFTIEEEKTAIVSWRLGAGATQPCTTYLIDENNNLVWDCGIDRMDFACPPENEYMFDFVIEYE